jgi:hypothetical protein
MNLGKRSKGLHAMHVKEEMEDRKNKIRLGRAIR